MKSLDTHSFDKHLLSPYKVPSIDIYNCLSENIAVNLASSSMFVLMPLLISPGRGGDLPAVAIG